MKTKTPIAKGIAQIKIWKEINRLTDEDFEGAGFDEIIKIFTGFLSEEKEVIEKAVAFGQMQDLKKTNFKYPDEYFNENYTQQ